MLDICLTTNQVLIRMIWFYSQSYNKYSEILPYCFCEELIMNFLLLLISDLLTDFTMSKLYGVQSMFKKRKYIAKYCNKHWYMVLFVWFHFHERKQTQCLMLDSSTDMWIHSLITHYNFQGFITTNPGKRKRKRERKEKETESFSPFLGWDEL